MESIYSFCAMIGGALVVIQTIMSAVGFGGSSFEALDSADVDVDLDLDTDIDVADGAADTWFVGFLSVRAILAAMTVFGLTGITLSGNLNGLQTMLASMLAAGGTMYAVAFVIRSMHKLTADGTVHIHDTVGQSGTVYLSLPANKESVGKVTVCVGERTMEYPAVTSGETLPVGTPIVVVQVLGETLEVAHVRETEYEVAGLM